jgi:hypothetical protein
VFSQRRDILGGEFGFLEESRADLRRQSTDPLAAENSEALRTRLLHVSNLVDRTAADVRTLETEVARRMEVECFFDDFVDLPFPWNFSLLVALAGIALASMPKMLAKLAAFRKRL